MLLELRGADMRERKHRENIWFSAMLPYLEKPPKLEDFLRTKLEPKERAKAFHAGWDRIDRALERGKVCARR